MTDWLLIGILLVVVAGRAYDVWRQRWPARTTYTTLDAAVNAMQRVASGLHEDADGLRKDVDQLRSELRQMLNLPPESRVPALLRELLINRWLMIVAGAIHIALILFLIWLVWELKRRGVLALAGL